jgi:hypothetical protein
MPVLVDDVARSTLSAVGSNAGQLLAIKWTSDRYRQLSNRGNLRALRRVAQITIPASIESGGTDGAVDGGLATFTRDSDIVTGNATAVATWSSLGQDIVGRYIRYRRVWYKVVNVEPVGADVQLRLENTVAEPDSTDTAYKLVQRHTKMPDDARRFGRFVQQRLWRPLSLVSLSELDLMYPERLFVVGTGPELCAEIGIGEDGRRLMEFYPYPHRAEAILFTYYIKSPDLVPGMQMPDEADVEAVKQGVLIDVYRFEMAKALRDNKVEVAAVWRNELRAQEKTWEDRLQELMRVDRSNDDINTLLHTQGPPTIGDFTFIRTARQDAISRLGNFP